MLDVLVGHKEIPQLSSYFCRVVERLERLHLHLICCSIQEEKYQPTRKSSLRLRSISIGGGVTVGEMVGGCSLAGIK